MRGKTQSTLSKMRLLSFPLLFAVFMLLRQVETAKVQVVVRLGFLMPYPKEDVAVSAPLADEWISAARVAVAVLRSQFKGRFAVQEFVANSNCSFEGGAAGASKLLLDSVVGVIGPACSEAVRGANSIFFPNKIPFISFAATAEEFANSEYDTFFRTVFPDSFQAQAVIDVARRFQREHLHIFYTNETYGRGLALKIEQLSAPKGISTHLIPIPFPPPPPNDTDQFVPFFYASSSRKGAFPALLSANDSTLSIVATTPNAAQGLWGAALQLGMLQSPWLFLGTDGATAFDPIEGGSSLEELTRAMQGELGLTAFRDSELLASKPIQGFLEFWRAMPHRSYPGLLNLNVSPPINHPRAFVPNLFDAIWTFFQASDHILHHQGQVDVTAGLLLRCLRNVYVDCIAFEGTTGLVQFDPSGERKWGISGDKALLSFVNFQNFSWQSVGSWDGDETSGQLTLNSTSGAFLPGSAPNSSVAFPPDIFDFSPTDIPISDALYNPQPPPPSGASSQGVTSPRESKGGGSEVALWGILIAIGSFSITVGVGVWLYYIRKNRFPEASQFVRME